MTTTIDETALFFGAPASLTVGMTEVGATLTPPKVNVKATIYAPEFQGAGGPISGAAFVTKIAASVEFDVNEITAAKLAWSMPGSTPTAGSGTPSGAGDAYASTLDDDVVAGSTILPVAATTAPIAAGMFVSIGTGATEEIRIVKEVIAGAALEVTEALFYDHSSTEDVVRLVDQGLTTVTWRTGRVPTSAFKDVVIDGVGVTGEHLIVTVSDALSDGTLTFEMSDSAVAGSHVTMTGYYDGSDPTLCPVQVQVGTP
jgi:hypothetical protein